MGIIFGQRAHPLDQLWIDSPRTENILKSLLSGLSYFPALAKNVMAGSESHPIFLPLPSYVSFFITRSG